MNREELRNQFQAELRIVRNSTIERKQMSTKTTFKRIALVAVAALGLGVLSVAPSQAVVGTLTITTAAGSADVTTGAANETTTAASISVSGLISDANDTVSVTVIQKSFPATGDSVRFKLGFVETNTAVGATIKRTAAGSALTTAANGVNGSVTVYDSTTAFTSAQSQAYIIGGAVGYAGAKINLMLDTTTARVAGTYVYTALVQSYSVATGLTKTETADLTFKVADTAANTALVSGTIAPSLSTAWINAGSTYTTASDSAVASVSTASATPVAAIRVRTYTVDGNLAPESVTVTVTGPGLVVNNSVSGKSISLVGTGGDSTFTVIPDGTAGTASIVVKTSTVTFPAKTVTFYSKAAKTITASLNKPAIAIGTTSDVVRAVITDANGTVWGGTAYIYAAAAADALVSGSATTPVACTFVAAYGYHACPTTAIAAGTANLKVIDASTVALSNATSSSVAVNVSAGTPTSVKIAFDKATYAPGEKATVTVSVLDAAGNIVPAQTVALALTTGGITSNTALGAQSDALTSTSVVVEGATSAALKTTAGAQQYTVYMPVSSGDVTLSATGSTGLALAGRVAVSATASVVNTSVDAATDAANEATDAANAATDAALAAADAADAATAAAQDASDAVAALSASVEKLVASLKAQLTSLTNLVIKIQKKVKA